MAEEPNFPDLQELLAARRDIMPEEDYFEGIVEKLHQRQMADMLKARQSFWGKLASLPESFAQNFTSHLPFTTPVRVAIPAMAAVALLAFGIFMSQTATQPAPAFAALTLDEQDSFLASFEEDFGTSTSLLAPPSQPHAAKPVEDIPHYVMAQSPSGVDAVVAF